MAVADDILALSIRHQIDLSRYSNGLVRDIGKLLTEAEAELVALIRARGEKGPFTTSRLKAMLKAIQSTNSDAWKLMYNELETPLLALAEHEAGSAAQTLTRSVPIKLDVVTPNVEVLKVLVSDQPIQGHLLAEWWASLELSMAQKVTQQIRLGIVSGESVDQMVRRLTGAARNYEAGIFSIVRRQCAVVVRSAVIHVSNQAAAATYRDNGDIVKGMIRLETLDLRTCKYCGSIDQTTVPLDSKDIAPFHPGCRGFCQPWLKSWKEMGIPFDELTPSQRASMDGMVPGKTDYGEFIKSRDFQDQKDALGATRARLMRDGGLEIKDFVNNEGIVYTIKDLVKREAAAFAKAFPK